MLEEFLMSILEEEDHDDILSQKDGMPPHFQNKVTEILNHKFPYRLAEVGLPLGHHVSLMFSYGGTSGMLCECHHLLPLYQNLLEE